MIGILKKVPAEQCKRKARAGDYIKVDYTGSLLDGTVFDSSLRPGRTPLEFGLGLGQVIPGWDRGLIGMCIGEKRKLTIPSHLAYGSAGAGAAIPPDATLVFTTELIGIQGYEPEEVAPAAKEEEKKKPVKEEKPVKAEKEAEELPEPETAESDEAEEESEAPADPTTKTEKEPKKSATGEEVPGPDATDESRDEL